MVKVIVTILVFVSCSYVYGEKIRVNGFEPEDKMKIWENLNCKVEKVEEKDVPEGKYCLKITMGGITNDKGGGVQIILPKENIPDDAKTISIWIKGISTNSFGPIIMLGGWSWKDVRYYEKAQIKVNDEEWKKHEFDINDFVQAHPSNKPEIDKQINKHRGFLIGLGQMKEYPESIVFYIDNIEIE